MNKINTRLQTGYIQQSFNVRIPQDLHRQAAIASSLKNMSLNDFVRFAIDFTLSKSGEIPRIARQNAVK